MSNESDPDDGFSSAVRPNPHMRALFIVCEKGYSQNPGSSPRPTTLAVVDATTRIRLYGSWYNIKILRNKIQLESVETTITISDGSDDLLRMINARMEDIDALRADINSLVLKLQDPDLDPSTRPSVMRTIDEYSQVVSMHLNTLKELENDRYPYTKTVKTEQHRVRITMRRGMLYYFEGKEVMWVRPAGDPVDLSNLAPELTSVDVQHETMRAKLPGVMRNSLTRLGVSAD